MKIPPATKNIRDDISPKGRQLLTLIVTRLRAKGFAPGSPETYLGYRECCEQLGVATPDMDVPWGRLLQQHGLNDLNGWTQRHGFPRVTGLVVNQSGERQYFPGGDYFASNGRKDTDFSWWEGEAKAAAVFDWKPYL